MESKLTERRDRNQQEKQGEAEELEVRIKLRSRLQAFFQKCYRQTKHKLHIFSVFHKENRSIFCSALCFYSLNQFKK